MLFDLFLTTKVSIKIEYPNKILLFIENLCFCSLKIAVCVLKITIISKNCRLKIAAESKNYGLKIPVRACMRVCMRVCMIVRTPRATREEHTPREHGTPPERRGTRKSRHI